MGLIGHPPFMVRAPGGARAGRSGRAHDPGGDATSRAWRTSPTRSRATPPPARRSLPTPACSTSPGLRIWVGYLDGEPVACSGAHVTDACIDVEYIATHERARRRGIGAAMTWAATLADPTKPAVLIASDPGQPVYEAMGYLRIARMTMWGGAPSS